MTDDETHRAVQESVNQHRSSIAPFGVPPTVAPEPGPATDSVPYLPDIQPQFDQLRPRPYNPAALEPASTFVPSPTQADLEAAIVGQRDMPLALRVATVTKQEQPDHPQSFTSPGVQEQPIPAEDKGSASSITSAISIVPTIYPNELGGTLTVEHHITINIYSTEFRELTAKVDEVLGELRRRNEIDSEVRDKLVGEITAGMAILRAPKPDPKMVDVLLIRPLKYLADKAAGPVMGAAALAALAALGRLTGLF
jgi:hypothetical protein